MCAPSPNGIMAVSLYRKVGVILLIHLRAAPKGFALLDAWAVWRETFTHGSLGNGFMIHTSVRYWKLSVFCFGWPANGRLGNLEWAAIFIISDSRSLLEMIHGAPGQTCFAGRILCCISLLTFVWPIPSSKLASCIVNSSRSCLSPSWYTGILLLLLNARNRTGFHVCPFAVVFPIRLRNATICLSGMILASSVIIVFVSTSVLNGLSPDLFFSTSSSVCSPPYQWMTSLIFWSFK